MKIQLHFNPENDMLIIETDDQVIPVLTTESKSKVLTNDVAKRQVLVSLTQTANQLHCNRDDMISRLISEGILFRDARGDLQADDYGIEHGWVVSCPINKPTYKGTYAKVTPRGLEYIADLMK